MCEKHYRRTLRHGSPDVVLPGGRGPAPRPVEDRFWPKVDRRGPDDCWLWKGAIGAAGYGHLNVPGRGNVGAHRIAYELLVGPIPDRLHLDHVVCAVPPCVNPAHLEPVTNAENVRRATQRRERDTLGRFTTR